MATLDEISSNPTEEIKFEGKEYILTTLRMDDYSAIMTALKRYLREEFDVVKTQLNSLNKDEIISSTLKIDILKLEIEKIAIDTKLLGDQLLDLSDVRVRQLESDRLNIWVTQLIKEREQLFDRAYRDLIVPSVMWMSSAYIDFMYTPNGSSISCFLMMKHHHPEITREITDTLLAKPAFFAKFLVAFERLMNSEESVRKAVKN